MAIRRGFWLFGIVAGGVFVASFHPGLSAGELIVGCGAIVLFAALIGELSLAALTLWPARHRSIEPPPGARPADGQIELVAIKGASGMPNSSDHRFSKFRTLDRSAESDLPPPSLAQGHGRHNPPLFGRVALVSLFIGRDGRSWSDDEIEQAYLALIRAAAWIEREAIRWNAPVNLAVAETYFAVDLEDAGEVEMSFQVEGDGVGPIEAHAMTKALIDSSRAASILGFRDAVDWMSQIRPRIDADVLVWLLHPRRAGRSLAIPLDSTELAGVSLAVCYAREASFPEPLTRPPWTDPATIAHELLHLFGASDKYGTSLRSYPSRSVSSRDIMRLNESRLSRLRIDRLTAAEIGWDVNAPALRERAGE